jgi:hypothetical protein
VPNFFRKLTAPGSCFSTHSSSPSTMHRILVSVTSLLIDKSAKAFCSSTSVQILSVAEIFIDRFISFPKCG